MSNVELLRILQQGPDQWNQWRKSNPTEEIDLQAADLRNANLVGVNFNKANLSGANLSDANLSGAHLVEVDLSETVCKFTDFSRSNLTSANLSQANLSNANLQAASLSKANLSNANLTDANLSEADLVSANLYEAKLIGSNFQHGSADRACLQKADLRGADISNKTFNRANLTDANLGGATLNNATSFAGATTDGCTIDRYQLERLSNYGGLTVGNRMAMDIRDGVAELRASYSGFMQWVHLTALLIFAFPYMWFVFVQWSKARFLPMESESYIPLWQALITFIYNGGMNWETGLAFHWSFVTFIFLTLYNILRAGLLWKTKQLELSQQSSGLPAMFSLAGSNWGTLFKFANFLFVVNLVVVLINTGHFFTQEIPISP